MLRKVQSGFQIGVDIAAIRAAKDAELETGGFMPRSFLTKEGPHPEYKELYGAIEILDSAYPPRTRRNVKTSDGTLRIAENFKSPGELVTMSAIRKYKKPYLDIPIVWSNLDEKWIFGSPRSLWFPSDEIGRWIINNKIQVLNVAGNALASLEKPVYELLKGVFAYVKEEQATKPVQAQTLGRIFKPPKRIM